MIDLAKVKEQSHKVIDSGNKFIVVDMDKNVVYCGGGDLQDAISAIAGQINMFTKDAIGQGLPATSFMDAVIRAAAAELTNDSKVLIQLDKEIRRREGVKL